MSNRREEFVAERIEEAVKSFERLQLAEYIRYMNNTKRMLGINFLAGLARGLGGAIGFTILGAIIIALLQRVVVDNMPWIGGFLADVIRTVQDNL